jgi:hypothetical protein
MTNFIFDWANTAIAAATLNLNTGNYYAHLVTTPPAQSSLTVADLTLPVINGYASTPLTGLSNNSSRWTFDSFSFPKYAFAAAPTGIVVCKRSGATAASTDEVICYSDFNNSINQPITLSVGAYVVNLNFGNNGAINYSYRYQYSSGAYVNTETIPKGLIYLIGTKNNTVAFSDPNPSKITQNTLGATSFTDRDHTMSASYNGLINMALDLGTLKIRPGTIGIFNYSTTNGSVQIWGSNNLGGNFSTNATNTSLYTSLGTFSVTGWEYAMKTFVVNNPDFWRYFLFQITPSGTGLSPTEIEFYSSSVLSPTQNFV